MSISTEGKILSFFQFDTHWFIAHNLLDNSTWLILKSLLMFLILHSSLYFTVCQLFIYYHKRYTWHFKNTKVQKGSTFVRNHIIIFSDLLIKKGVIFLWN